MQDDTHANPTPRPPVRSLKLAFLLAVLATAAIAVLRVADVISDADARWYGGRAFAVIAILAVAALVTGAFSRNAPEANDPSDRQVP